MNSIIIFPLLPGPLPELRGPQLPLLFASSAGASASSAGASAASSAGASVSRLPLLPELQSPLLPGLWPLLPGLQEPLLPELHCFASSAGASVTPFVQLLVPGVFFLVLILLAVRYIQKQALG